MKRKIKLFILTLLISVSGFAQSYDTVANLQMGMGIFYTKVVEYTRPWSIDILEIDLTVPYNKLETAKANNRLKGYERTSSMAARNSRPGHVVVGAINGDFYGGAGEPISMQILNGEALKLPIDKSLFAVTESGKPVLARMNYTGRVWRGNQSYSINNVNQTRGTDQLILYNTFMGTATATNIYGTEVGVKALNTWMVNDTVYCIVVLKTAGTGNMAINDSVKVLSGNGAAATFLNSFNVGDTIKIAQFVSPAPRRIKELIGGFPRIVMNGANYVVQGYNEEGGPSHTFERHPRTAVGFSQDSTKVWFITVDGRQPHSAGMTLNELADFMIRLGIYHGVNFDGGGSTTMVVRDSVVNKVSDGPGVERTVSNALMVVSSAPQGALNRVKVQPGFNKIFRGESVQFRVYGFDEYFNPVQLVPAQIQYTLDPGLGSITSAGVFTAGQAPDTGYLRINYNGLRDSALIIVKGIDRIAIYPRSVVTDTSRIVNFTMSSFDMDSVPRPMLLTEYNWSVSNPSVLTVTAAGKIKGLAPGVSYVKAAYENLADSALVEVKVESGSAVLSIMDELQGWTLVSENVDTAVTKMTLTESPRTMGAKAFKVNYKFTYNSTQVNWIYLRNNIPVQGVPDSIKVDVYSDGRQHHITYLVSDDDNETFRIPASRYADKADQYDTMAIAVSRAVPTGTSGTFNFPVSFREIQVRLGSTRVNGQVYEGTLYFDNLRVRYPLQPTDIFADENTLSKEYYLMQNYPNPFNPSTTISYTVPSYSRVGIKLYDVTGKEIMSLLDEEKAPGNYSFNFDASGLASGIYFYKLQAGDFTSVKKMTFMK
ncbi:MAG: phosphodiester glycosidase family protein [Ignavibacteriaceae bacterium]|nr:phosphodiester glycosidase family protein [Ignavibacteriaceae bacterium]